MAFSANLIDYITKARDATFKDRLRSALMSESRYHSQSAGTTTRDDAIRDYSRRVRYLIWSDEWLHSAGLHVLWSVGSENVDNDTELSAIVTSKFLELSESALPA